MQYTLPPHFVHASLLVVDDSEINRDVLTLMLGKAGFKNIHMAANGREALSLTLRQPPALVLLDIMMPEMNGYEYLAALRSKAEFAELPVIVQTVLDEHENRLRAFQAGASDFIMKPIDQEELCIRCHIHLEKSFLLAQYRALQSRVEEEQAMLAAVLKDVDIASVPENIRHALMAAQDILAAA